MRLIALLILPSLAFANPVPNPREKPGIEVKLFAKTSHVLEITIQNNGKEPLQLPYSVTPFEHVAIDLRGEKGKQYKIEHTDKNVPGAKPGILQIPAGQSTTLSLHTCHYVPLVADREEKITFTARLKHARKTIESKPLTVNP